mmetsp:Transcript_19919/g.33071  ORF Transcript_19919/g.33071 Transcript_19919/m.33071 type:complete len:558 (+) Transcript_19919:89-1762(+)
MKFYGIRVFLLGLQGASTFLLSPPSTKVHRSAVLQVQANSAAGGWSEDDDWGRLSSTENTAARPIAGEDLATSAAHSMEQMVFLEEDRDPLSEEDQRVFDMIEDINDSTFADGSEVRMYDAPGDKTQITFEDKMGREISLLVRCNESPEELLVEEGRALPPLTDEERDDVSQLVSYIDDKDGSVKVSDFFRHAIAVMFREHATALDDGGAKTIMKSSGVASWMSKSLDSHVSAHDKRVLSIVTRFSEYGTGYLTADNFDQVYHAAITAALDGTSLAVSRSTGIKGQPTTDTIWRDIRNHNIISPVEAEREMKMLEIRKKSGELDRAETPFRLNAEVMDECEILEDGQTYATSTFQTSWSDVKKKELSSHELVEMAADGKTPLYLRDGEFIFIDEESCIGCIQCASTAPSSFLMLDHGRARSYLQSNSPDVKAAVATCPVSCMHSVSFDELKEMETAREKGDGRSDHKHCGSSKGYTPLHVARRGTDANKKDSWFHYLKQKCFLSKECPQRGCFACPNYSNPGENPYWKIKHTQAEHVRATTFIEGGVADPYRKTVDL